MKLSIKAYPSLGDTVKTSILEAINLGIRTGANVDLEFNGVTLYICSDSYNQDPPMYIQTQLIAYHRGLEAIAKEAEQSKSLGNPAYSD